MPKIVVLVSGGGSNLQSIIDSIESGDLKATITTVIADREAHGLERAKSHGIDNYLVSRKEFGKTVCNEIDKKIPADTDLIVLAGFLSILTAEFTKKWAGKMINIHPSLLPKFGGKGMYGMNVHKAVVEAGEKESGCTVHFVEAGIDTGAVIFQDRITVEPADQPEDVAKKVLAKEHKLLVKAIKKVLNQI